MRVLTSTKKLSLWWPNSAVDAAEHDVLKMKLGGLWNYKYGSVTLAPGAVVQDVIAAAADPSDSYDFAWNADTP